MCISTCDSSFNGPGPPSFLTVLLGSLFAPKLAYDTPKPVPTCLFLHTLAVAKVHLLFSWRHGGSGIFCFGPFAVNVFVCKILSS
jgi:hypothetical protein